MIRNYESIILFDSALTDPQLAEQVEAVSALLKKEGAENLSVDHWGRREISYQLRKSKKSHAFFVCFYYECSNSGIVDGLNQSLRINDAALMYQTHRITESTRKFKGRINNNPDQDQMF